MSVFITVPVIGVGDCLVNIERITSARPMVGDDDEKFLRIFLNAYDIDNHTMDYVDTHWNIHELARTIQCRVIMRAQDLAPKREDDE